MERRLERELTDELARLEQAGLRRHLPAGTHSARAEPGHADFTSNDTLGLSRHPDVVRAVRSAVASYGAGGRAARLLGGGSPSDARAEAAAADWLGAEAALLFPTGYHANLGLVGALVAPGDALLCDARNHASLIDAARLARARVSVFRHADAGDLERALEQARGARRRWVLSESVFSMDGDLAPLAEIEGLCERHDAHLLLDEAHAAGLLGPEGAGAWARRAGRPAPPSRLAARVVTGGKALGVAGAFVCGSRTLREVLLNRARTFLFTTAVPPAVSAGLETAIGVCRGADDRRRAALDRAARLADALDLPTPAAAIVFVPVGDAHEAVELADSLCGEGLGVRAVRPPTVPEAGLRVVCRADAEDADLERLAQRLSERGPRAATEPARATSPALFVVGTDTGVGKTVVSALLARAASRAGADPRYWKPVQTGDESDTTELARLAGLDEARLLPPLWELPLPASPHEAAAAAGTAIDPEGLRAALARHRVEQAPAPLVVELAGGLLVPLTDDWSQADWLAEERPPVVLVARSGLGTLNHTRLSLEALRARHVEPLALVLVGEPHPSNRATLERLGGVPCIVELPPLDPLSPAALDAWLDAAGPLDMPLPWPA